MRKVSLKALLKDATADVRQAAADAVNEATEQLQAQIRANMNSAGIVERTGRLRVSLKATKATPKNPRALIKSEVYAKIPKRPGSRNPAMRGRYKYGVPYGRILEFSPRIRKPFFYSAWYGLRAQVKEEIIKKIGEAWSNGSPER